MSGWCVSNLVMASPMIMNNRSTNKDTFQSALYSSNVVSAARQC